MAFEAEYDKEIIESEKSILSSVFYYSKEISSLVDIDSISINRFVTMPAKRVFQAIRDTKLVDGKYDPVLVLNKLKKYCLGEQELNRCIIYVQELSKDIHYFSIKKYLSILNESKIKRDLDALARKILRKNLSADNFNDHLEEWRYIFSNIVSQSNAINYLEAKDAIKSFDDMVNMSNTEQKNSFLKTTYSEVDKKIKFLSGGQLIIIASRPGVGKTTFSLNLIYNNFSNIEKKKDISVDAKPPAIGIFSLEMTTLSLITKLIAINSKMELSAVQRLLDGGNLADYEHKLIDMSRKRISNLNLLFCDEANITIGKIISTIKSWVKEYDIKLIIVDYLQLVNLPQDRSSDGMNQYQKIGMISRSLKVLAMELNICIIALAQLNRKSEERKGGEKSPILSDLRESGSIEQDADIVMFLYEDKSSNQINDDEEKNHNFSSTTTMLKIAKNRHGPIGQIAFTFDKVFGTYNLKN